METVFVWKQVGLILSKNIIILCQAFRVCVCAYIYIYIYILHIGEKFEKKKRKEKENNASRDTNYLIKKCSTCWCDE